MQGTPDNIFIIVLLGIIGTFLLVVSFILFTIRNQNKLLKQRQNFQQAEIAHQKNLLHAIIESQEAERKRIGQDLHDDVGTSLSGLRLMIEMFKPSADDSYQQFAGTSKSVIDKIIKDVRNISHNLSPTTLRYYGLAAAITEHCTIINQSGKLEVILVNDADYLLQKLELPAATAIYRVLEELLNNTIKHSGASSAEIRFSDAANNLDILYSDNGKGLQKSLQEAVKGMGMQNIESRLLNINATFTIHPYNGQGFCTNIKYPFN
ncbi:sensor histidine kinase [Mucilaginibacter sp.]|uniref:sensor histidine kinase n=1 Tax=Mucilaginibacter sp. TaxID=1882438 RepID=UPI0035BBFFD4